jgi:hypothetical protein
VSATITDIEPTINKDKVCHKGLGEAPAAKQATGGGTGFSFGGAPAATHSTSCCCRRGSPSMGEVLHLPPNQQLWRDFFCGGGVELCRRSTTSKSSRDFIWWRTRQLLSNHVGIGARKPATTGATRGTAFPLWRASGVIACQPTAEILSQYAVILGVELGRLLHFTNHMDPKQSPKQTSSTPPYHF